MTIETLNSLLSRKFLVSVLALLLGVLAVPEVSGEDKLSFLKWIVGLYAAGNVAATMADKEGGVDEPVA